MHTPKQEHITNLPDVVRASPLGPLLVGFLDSMEQRMKSFAQQGHMFRPDVQHVEAYHTPDSYAGAMRGGASTDQVTDEAADKATRVAATSASGGAASGDNGNAPAADAKQDFERRLRAEFNRLMAAGGTTPNEAAAQALRNIRSAT